MKKTKRILSLLIAAILLFSVLPLTAFAAETDLAESGAIRAISSPSPTLQRYSAIPPLSKPTRTSVNRYE